MEKKLAPKFDFELNDEFLRIKSDSEVWGTQPFLALKTIAGRYVRDDFINDDGNQWTYAFDGHTIELNALSHIGIACNDDIGNTTVSVCDVQGDREWQTKVWHQDDWVV